VAVVLTLVQTKQIRINIHKRNNTKNTVQTIQNTVQTIQNTVQTIQNTVQTIQNTVQTIQNTVQTIQNTVNNSHAYYVLRPFCLSEFERPTNTYRRLGKNSRYSYSLHA